MRVDEAFTFIKNAHAKNRLTSGLLIIGDVRGDAALLSTKILQLLLFTQDFFCKFGQ